MDTTVFSPSSSLKSWSDLAETFRKEGIPIPEPPSTHASRLAEVSPFVFSSLPMRHDLYDTAAWVNDFVTGSIDESLSLGCSGHGIQSWGFHWYEVTGCSAIFLQLPWGGAYHNPTLCAGVISAAGDLAIEIREEVDRARSADLIPPGWRFLYVDSFQALNGSGWVAKNPGSAPAEVTQWSSHLPTARELRAKIAAGPLQG